MKLAKLATAAAAVRSGRSAWPRAVRPRRPPTRPAQSTAGALIGVTMPTKSSERWITDGNNVKAALEKLGYKVDLQYAENDIPTQVNQIENQITKGAKLLIIASIDGTALTTQLQEAADKQHPGHRLRPADPQQRRTSTTTPPSTTTRSACSRRRRCWSASACKKEDGSDGTAKGPFNIELFAGSPDDNNATFFFNGAMATLKPLHRQRARSSSRAARPTSRPSRSCAGTRRPRRSAWRTCSPRPTPAAPRSHGVLSPYDGLSIGILSALQERRLRHRRPAVPDRHRSGRRGRVGQVDHRGRAVLDRSTRTPASSPTSPSTMADAVLKGGKPEVNNTRTTTTASRSSRRTCSQPVVVYKDNYQKVLVDSRLLHRPTS